MRAFQQITEGPLASRSFPKLWHVGSLDVAHKGEGSLEGAGLSVSVHPEEWSRIARLGGEVWSVTKPGNKFLDFHRMPPFERQRMMKWGIAQGYLTRKSTFRFWSTDEEGEERYMTFSSRAEAEKESDPEFEVGRVEEVPDGIIGTDALVQRTMQDRQPYDDMALELLSTLYVEDVLKFDGVWWNDILDVGNLSAPRGVIVPSMINTWRIEREDR